MQMQNRSGATNNYQGQTLNNFFPQPPGSAQPSVTNMNVNMNVNVNLNVNVKNN